MGRVTFKSNRVEWNKPSGAGSLFHVHLLDAAGGQIKATFYNDACQQFYNVIHQGKVIILVFNYLSIISYVCFRFTCLQMDR